MSLEKKVLNFTAYFEEPVPFSRIESSRVRRCVIYMYLEDESIQILEPKEMNSGIPQGSLVRRQRIPKNGVAGMSNSAKVMTAIKPSDELFTLHDLNIGADLMIFGRNYHLLDCDTFTRRFLEEYLEVDVPAAETVPEDSHRQQREQMQQSLRPVRGPREGKGALKQFLVHDGRVLRFMCVWDEHGDGDAFGHEHYNPNCRRFELLYFLADDTIKLLEQIPPNSGRDGAPIFAKRQPAPESLPALSDLLIGATLYIFSRTFLIVDVDRFTQEFYHANFGIVDFMPLGPQAQASSPLTRSPSRQIPEHNGFGTEEDSLGNCLSLVPKPPKKDWHKLVHNDKKVLRFLAKLSVETPNLRPIDGERRFVVTFHLADDTVSIFEPPIRNSGIIGGKFLERMRVKKPLQPIRISPSMERRTPLSPTMGRSPTIDRRAPLSPTLDRSRTPGLTSSPERSRAASPLERSRMPSPVLTRSVMASDTRPSSPGSPGGEGAYYIASDFYIGATIQVYANKFVLFEASEFVHSHMEANPKDFPLADLDRIINDIAQQIDELNLDLKSKFAQYDRSGRGLVRTEDFRSVLGGSGLSLTDQEVLTLTRRYDADGNGRVSYDEFCAVLG